MAVTFEREQGPQPTSRIPVKSLLLNTLVRHASAPAISQHTTTLVTTSESISTSKSHMPHNPQTPAASPRRKNPPRSPPSHTQIRTLIRHLRRDRDAQVQKQALDLAASKTLLQQQAQTLAKLEEENRSLHTRHQSSLSHVGKLLQRIHDLAAKHDTLTTQLFDSLRTVARLKKSDRAKGKVQQRNLRLKAMLQRYTDEAGHSNTADPDTEAALREALAAANARVEELERSGEVLLRAMEREGASDSEDEDDDLQPGLLEAEVMFRGVLEDEEYREQRENWGELLGE